MQGRQRNLQRKLGEQDRASGWKEMNILGRLLKSREKSPPALLVCPWLLWSGLGKHS